LTNLLANALSFTPEGGTVTIKLRRRPRAIELMVEDDGPGIDPENLERIFARFYTYRPTKNTSRGDNSGLGLAISREIVEAHNGEVWAENIWPSGSQKPAHGEERKPLGARFVVRLPVATHSEHTKTGRLSGGR
ncbi:MAG: sensor histidine kinase, partial [Alphaproteobacteria bacterium]|nr:sensor histidine kinase [Alphaproteobacteria bacterium]